MDLDGDHSLLSMQIKGTLSSACIPTVASCPANIDLSLKRINQLTNMGIFLNPNSKLSFGHLKTKLNKILRGVG
jgi:hypothetical protein